MISNLRFTFMAFIMLVLLGFGFQNQANGQVGLDGLFCPAVPNDTGWLETVITSSGADFTGSVIGTVEDSGADAVAGLDWQHVDALGYANNPTNEPGTQLVTWWTQKDDRNTYVQVTNASPDAVTVHVRIHNESCGEIRDFCDTYTGFDTHEYNLGDLFSNGGADIADGNLQGNEGWLVVTAVKDCSGPNELPIPYDYLTGQLIVHDADDYVYGANTYARRSICEDELVELQKVPDGSFQSGEIGNCGSRTCDLADDDDGADQWRTGQSEGIIALAENFNPAQTTPANPYNSPYMGFVVAADDDDGSVSSDACFLGGSYENINGCFSDDDDADACLSPRQTNCNFLNLSDQPTTDLVDKNVALIQSESFETHVADLKLTYNLQLFTPRESWDCSNYTAVLLIRDDEQVAEDDCPPEQLCGTIVDARCYQEQRADDRGVIEFDNDLDGHAESRDCQLVRDSDDDIAFGSWEFTGATGWQTNQMLETATPGTYRIQVITAQTDIDTGRSCYDSSDDVTGGLVNNFQLIEEKFIPCDNCLDGAPNAKLANVNPGTLYGQFDLIPGNTQAGADVVHINFADDYGAGVGAIGSGPYRPVPAFSNVSVSIFDEFEQDQSCGDASVCFIRLGIDDALVLSDNFQPPTPTPTPTITPTATPIPTPTPTPTGGGGGGSGSCAVAGSPVQLGTALANVLIPLVPVAFAFGVRAVRRRKK